ncbi:MAG TPA: hypothetical protein VKS44_08590 [Candidatus Acidoferrales bacterium]|nr:hypothetical protein [Candidatus Acidoferrales bacterium]
MAITNERLNGRPGYGGDRSPESPAQTPDDKPAGNQSLRDPGTVIDADHNVFPGAVPNGGVLEVTPGDLVPAGEHNIPRPTSATPAPRPAAPDASINPAKYPFEYPFGGPQ